MTKKISLIALSLLMLVMIFASCGKAVEISVNFVVDGEVYHTISTTGKEAITMPQNPTKEGYVFEGWYWDENIFQKPFTANSLLNQELSDDMSVYAKWTLEDITKKNYDLTFNSMGGSDVTTQSVLYGNVANAPTNPTKAGYIFVGWYKEADYTTKWNFSADTVTENTTIYAKWVVENDAQGSAIIEAPSFEIKDKVLSIEIPNAQEQLAISDLITVSPYATYKVTTDIEGANEIPSGTVTVDAGDNTFYILVTSGTGSNKTQYTVNVHRRLMLNVTYDFNNGSESVVEVFEEDSKITSKEASKTGYTFVEWQFNGIAWDFENGVILDNMTIKATYNANKYEVSFNSNGGTEIENATVTFDAPFTFEIPARLGYAFDGWRNAQGDLLTNAQGEGNTVWTIPNDTALFAQWTPIGYEITYHNVDGATNNNMPTYDVEDEPLELLDASKTGYIFLGWYTDSEFENAITEIVVGTVGELDLYAKWEVIEYTAIFMDGATKVDEITFTVETESIESPEVPNHLGYIGEWESYTLGASDITVNAVYTPIVYTITYEGTKGAANSNPVTYTIESATITLADISATGYTFDGWTKNSEAITEIAQGTTGNIVLTANWTVIQYNITYMYDSAIGDYVDANKNPATYTVEDDFDFIALVNKTTGYTFDGWYTEKNTGTGTKVSGIEAGSTGDITIYAHWALDEYTITYHNANGITNTNATTYTVETDTFEIFDISKEGYTFNGWYSDSAFGTQVTEIAKGTTGNIDLYAKWTPTEYTIEYVLYGGIYAEGVTNPSKYTIEDTIIFNAPTLEGYVFDGWYSSADYNNKVEKLDGNTGNVTLYAKWIHISTITFITNGGNSIASITLPAGTALDLPEATKDYYDFANWYTNIDLTNKFTSLVMPDDDITLYAKYTPIVYTITYVLNGGTNASGATVKYTIEDTVTLLSPSKTGYTFVGWFTDDKFTSSVVTELKNEHGDKTFYANYKINQYTISFNTNGGTEVEAITQNYDTSVTAPSAPAKNGYKFAGWYSDSALKNAYTFTTMPAEDITLYAKWTLETYNITYNLVGGANNKNNPASFNIQSADIILQAPTKTGYNFAGWYTDSEYENAITEIANGTYGNVELYAKWEIITYTITYVATDGSENINSTTYTVETDLTSLADATLKGHTFGGWYKDSAYSTRVYQIGGGETGDITLYAKFTANTYDVWLDGTDEASFDVSFDLNGADGEAATQTVTENNTLKYPTVPTREGYVFGGWYREKDCAGDLYDFTAPITSDITLYAKWIEADKAITVNTNTTVTINGKEEQRFTFVPLVSGNVTFTTTGSYDTLGILYDANGNVLRMDDDTGSDGVNFQIVFNVTAGEVYTIAVRSYSSATSGTAPLYVSGSNTVSAGGYVITGNKTQITYGSDFTIDMPSAREGYKFLGWADKNGTMYTDGTGKGVKAWDKDETTLLVSVWERTVYTITFVTSGGTAIDAVSLAYGERLDISKYVTTRANYTFDCWMLDGTEFEATTMPDHNITLTAKWKTFALGDIKYDSSKIAISVNDEITAELFDALCLDTNGNKAEFTVTVSGTQEAGQTISVRLVAKSGTKTKQATITGIKVYGAPTLDFDNTVDYVNLVGGMTAEHFSAVGTDTFGNATEIKVYIEGQHKAGDVVTVTIEAVDVAGNITKGYVENVKAYGLPEITYNEEKTAISANDTLSANLFSATAKDSFGNDLTVTVSKYSGTISAGNSVTIRISATDEKGNTTNIDVVCKVYGTPTISDATTTDVKESDTITPDLLGITGKDTFNNALNVTLTVKEGTQEAGTVMTVTATVTDIAGNTATKDFEIKVYGTPTLTYDREGIKVSEDPTKPASTVTFNLNGASGSVASQTVTDTVGLVYPQIPTRSGYVFAGWYTTSACTGTPYDFSAKVDSDTTLYAKWISYSGGGIVPYNGNITVSVQSKSSSATTSQYYAFVPLVDGTITIYSANGLSDTYGYLYNSSKTQLKTDDDSGDGSNFSITYSVKAGTLYYIRPCGYSSSGTTTVYLTGAKPNVGGKAAGAAILNAIATDSFGENLKITVTVKSGSLIGGTYIVYTLTATDKVGNTYSIDTAPIGVYDIVDIENSFSYNEYMSDLAKLSSNGSEFDAAAKDSFGNACTITIEAADGSALAGGQTTSIVLVATDKAGNRVVSDPIESIRIFDMPTFTLNEDKDGYYLEEGEDISFLFIAYDSFGQELYAEASYEGTFSAGNFIDITVTATDDANNTAVQTYTVAVISNEYPAYVDLYVDGTLYSSQFVDATYKIPAIEDVRVFAGWKDESGTLYTDANGNLLKEITGTVKLYATFEYEYIIYTVEDLKSISMDGKYVLANDIDLGGIKWAPLGTSSKPFTGIFNGNGHVISNFKITSQYKDVGLFGYNTGTIKNLGVENFTINVSRSDKIYAGGLVGYNYNGTITNCYATGSVTATAHSISSYASASAGGLVGYNDGGTITNCYATGSVTATATTTSTSSSSSSSSSARAGGLVGYNDGGTITNCYAEGDVKATATTTSTYSDYSSCAYAGGLVGYNNGSGTITNCYAEGDVKATASSSDYSSDYSSSAFAGGLVGYNSGTIEDCYATGSVTATSSDASSYAYAGGLVGRNYGTITNCYRYSSQIFTVNKGSTTTTSPTNTLGTAKTMAELQSVSFHTSTLGWSTDNWTFVEGAYPTLKNVGVNN